MLCLFGVDAKHPSQQLFGDIEWFSSVETILSIEDKASCSDSE